MTRNDLALYIATGLVALIGIGCAAGARILWTGAPDTWEDVVAGNEIVVRTSRALAAVAGLLIVSALATGFRLPYASIIAAAGVGLFVIGGFVGNYYVFDDIRPMHTGPNIVIAGIVWALLWFGMRTA